MNRQCGVHKWCGVHRRCCWATFCGLWGAKIFESRSAPRGLGWRETLLQGSGQDGVLVLALSRAPCSVSRICGAIWSPIFSCPAVAARCIGDAVRSSDPACSGPTWVASVDILVQASLARDGWQLMAAGSSASSWPAGSSASSWPSGSNASSWQLATARATLAPARKASSGSWL